MAFPCKAINIQTISMETCFDGKGCCIVLRDAENANSKPDKMIKCKCWTTVSQLLQCGQTDKCPHMRNFQINPAFGNKYAEYTNYCWTQCPIQQNVLGSFNGGLDLGLETGSLGFQFKLLRKLKRHFESSLYIFLFCQVMWELYRIVVSYCGCAIIY